MLTPRFSLEQDDTFITVIIYAPFTNISDTEIFMDELDFRFYSKPYFLRLHLPNAIEETDLASAKYNADTNSFVVKAPKKVAGQFFPGLEMISELLKPKGSTAIPPEIEISEEIDEALSEEDEDIDCYFEQHIHSEDNSVNLADGNNGYGFAFSHTNVFSKLLDECQEILDIKDLDRKTFSIRSLERKGLENTAFSSEHYLADLFDTSDELNSILNLDSKLKDMADFSKEETERMVALGTQRKISVKVTKENLSNVSLNLLDILFAYCYDYRTTEFEHNSESAWTISKLCATLSCGEKYVNMKECVLTCIRRSLCYPLYRHWELSLLAWNDVCDVLEHGGKKKIIKILLTIIPIFLSSEGYYLYNQLYIDEYAVWCQTLPDTWTTKCLEQLKDVLNSINKSEVMLELDEIESFGRDLLSKQEKSDNGVVDEKDLVKSIATLEINESKTDSDDSDSNSSESETESDDSSDSSDTEGSGLSKNVESSSRDSGINEVKSEGKTWTNV